MANYQKVKLPAVKPDRCVDCPLLGLVPAGVARPRYSKKSHLCIGTAVAMSKAKTEIRASESNDPKHPLERPCDEHWERWMAYPRQILRVNKALYRDSRDPYMLDRYPEINFGD